MLYAVQGRISDELFNGRTTQAAWRDKPTFYAVSKNDRTINPDLERFMAQRMNAKTIELDASHLSIVSKAQRGRRPHHRGHRRVSASTWTRRRSDKHDRLAAIEHHVDGKVIETAGCARRWRRCYGRAIASHSRATTRSRPTSCPARWPSAIPARSTACTC